MQPAGFPPPPLIQCEDVVGVLCSYIEHVQLFGHFHRLECHNSIKILII